MALSRDVKIIGLIRSSRQNDSQGNAGAGLRTWRPRVTRRGVAILAVASAVAGVQPQAPLSGLVTHDPHQRPEPVVAGDGGGRDGVAARGHAAPEALPGAQAPAGGLTAFSAPQGAQQQAAGAVAAYAERVAATVAWKLRAVPLRPPPPPARKPRLRTEPGHVTGAGLPKVITQVPTDDKVIFLTIDDGADKDPRLLAMLDDLDVPFSAFLTDYVARDDYGYFRKAHAAGTGIHNHTINHKELPRLSRAGKRKEICGQQDVLAREFGEATGLFRPPYGAYDRDTLRTAAECRVTVVPLWAEEAFPDRIEWAREDRRFHAGDILLTHFRGREQWRGDMTDMLRRVLDTATEQGFAVARLEDYV